MAQVQFKLNTYYYIKAYRESAYLWAMSAAGAAWGVATACAQGWLDECRCVEGSTDSGQSSAAIVGEGSRVGWEWSGCSYGIQVYHNTW